MRQTWLQTPGARGTLAVVNAEAPASCSSMGLELCD